MSFPCPGERAALEAGAFDLVQCSLCREMVEGGSVIKGRSGHICERCADEEYPKPPTARTNEFR